MIKSGAVYGKVQGVMFRQTFIRACLVRQLAGGVTNDPSQEDRVTFTLLGEDELVLEIIERLSKPEILNSWQASVEKLEILEQPIPIVQHEVTTDNVDDFEWSPGVEFYL
ncbi:MAG: hypothetical protein HN509_07130 [Halobacteriovoraceae bacterium]|nr:hypothetical protein [Halobacteriovoraceae bacterium]MBT5095225.1 hypothetical protein [Halobacteriovoraceae bacterium]